MKKRIITISREYGSGGRLVGSLVAEKLGVAFYDKALVKHVADETGFHEKYIEQQGEYAPTKSLFGFAMTAKGSAGAMNGLSANDYLWITQSDVITQLAEKEPCVIVGRCADYILRDRDDVFNVFIHAPYTARAKRIREEYGDETENAQALLEDKDKKRKVYYKHYTGREWGRFQNYDLALNTETIGLERCVDIICGIVK
ncbi:MAG: cytidylate kinase-like family protein [Oscillospiraceae bacterium]|nr:cytidylate kinase-like family protein [Oscillospiraceae bacterium]MCD8343628.1 cytidylate kinase-like family protein [Oscillospiraceae bacterium]